MNFKICVSSVFHLWLKKTQPHLCNLWMILLVVCGAVSVGAQEELKEAFRNRPKDAVTRITSNKLDYDYKDNIAIFDGKVKVTDPQFTLTADRIMVFFDTGGGGTNNVRRLDASGNVHVVSEDREGKCGRAVYTRATATVVMLDSPVAKKGENSLKGEKITIFLEDSRIEVEGGVQLEGGVEKKDEGKNEVTGGKTE